MKVKVWHNKFNICFCCNLCGSVEELNLKVDISTENHQEAWVGSVYKPIIFVIIVKLALAGSDLHCLIEGTAPDAG